MKIVFTKKILKDRSVGPTQENIKEKKIRTKTIIF